MATFSSLGVGAGVDLQSLLTKLMTVERAPIQALETKLSSTNSKLSMYGTLKSKLDTLASAADTLQFPSRLSALSATSADAGVVSANATFVATAGSYTVQVVNTAAAQKSNTAGYAAGTTFSAGTLTFTVGDPDGTTTDHVVDLSGGGPYELSDIRNAINTAGFGVNATIVNASDGSQHLVMTSASTGKQGTFSLAASGLTPSAGDPLDSLTTFTAAADATIKIDGISLKSSTNDFTDAVPGVTFTAKSAGTTTVTVATDNARISAALKTFVESYNAVVTHIKSNSAYNDTTKTAQAFNGDSAARSVLSTLAGTRTQIPAELASATFKNLFEIGISVDKAGLLSLDETKLNQAISTSAADVTKLVQGYGKSFSDMVASLQSVSGVVANKVTSLNSLVTSFENQKESLEIRVANIEKGYRRQFTALDKLISSMQQTSSYLTQQLAGLSKSS